MWAKFGMAWVKWPHNQRFGELTGHVSYTVLVVATLLPCSGLSVATELYSSLTSAATVGKACELRIGSHKLNSCY